MKLFYATFRSEHMLADYWVEILAEDEVVVRFVLKEQFGPIWSGCYSTEDFDQIKYSGGRIGRFMAWPNGIDRAHCRRIDPSELIYRAEMRSNQITEDVF